MSAAQRLVADAGQLGVTVTEQAALRLVRLLDELERWNRTYNLTAITNREEMVTHHLLDSLAVQPDLQGETLADVGTGAGFPGLPLAVVNPHRRFTLIDSNGKKIRFVSHAVRTLGLANVETLHARVESLKAAVQFDTVIARAFAALPEMIEKIAAVCGPQTRVVAMKGRWPREEVDALPRGWSVVSSRQVEVPGLKAERCVIVLQPPGRSGGG